MTEIFSPNHYVWMIPLGCFALLIIAATCYFLRREILSFLRKIFFSDTNRYTIPAGIISNVNTEKPQKAAFSKSADLLSKARKYKTKNDFLRKIEVNLRWHFRKFKHAFSKWFAEFANTEDSPSNTAKARKMAAKTMQQRAAQPKEDAAPYADKASAPENQPPAAAPEQADKNLAIGRDTSLPNTRREEEITESRPSKPVEELPVAAAEELRARETANSQAERRGKKWNNFIDDRIALIAALLILAGFLIFLGARVKLLGSIVMRQRVEMRNMQKQIEIIRYEQSGYKVVIHERAIFPQKRYNR